MNLMMRNGEINKDVGVFYGWEVFLLMMTVL